MKKYSLGYDYTMTASDFNSSDELIWNGERIGSVVVNVLFHLMDENGKEIFFEGDETDYNYLPDQPITLTNGEQAYLYQLFMCSYNEEEGFEINPNIEKVRHLKNSMQFEVHSYCKDVYESEYMCESIEITKEELMEIITKNKRFFDNPDNVSAQTCSYFTQEIKEE